MCRRAIRRNSRSCSRRHALETAAKHPDPGLSRPSDAGKSTSRQTCRFTLASRSLEWRWAARIRLAMYSAPCPNGERVDHGRTATSSRASANDLIHGRKWQSRYLEVGSALPCKRILKTTTTTTFNGQGRLCDTRSHVQA
ncbi:hypothetical protein PYCCODRAFT_805528 [Trametes coccinea BRFM310]|uniref:Uncharacterized protein n=1 Tax=Trametes coccinea (strain BRFM310) TaxID=1353009 RepID=A0A1Y2I6K3_TRAC3|nr:hypothetical protein PYCCODRAFT_123421 [Trametes coccinea BRFM310]OSC99732.1 hypothetical protein PYCCODRAFT_805528 [Trametes coccinea BRFM310]